MVHYFIYAKDYSGSTDGDPFYHNNGLDTLELFKSDVERMKSELPVNEESRIIYLHWGHICEEVSEETTVQTYKAQEGQGHNTLPERIVEWLKSNIDVSNNIKLLYIITDGQIYNHSRCHDLNKDIHYENVIFHAINKDWGCIDLSVTASFIKGRCSIYRNNELIDDTDVSKEFDYDQITAENFPTEKETMKTYIKYKFLNEAKSNTKALAEIDKLKKLRNRLFDYLSSGKDTFSDTKDKNTFMKEFMNTNWYRSASNAEYNLKVDVEKSISTLINYIVSEKKSYAFDNLKYETNFSSEVVEEPVDDVNFAPDQEIEFPDVILDDEKGIPVILLSEVNLLDKIIFKTSETSASFSKFKTTMECPLYLMEDTDISESIGYFYTLNVYKQLLASGTKTDPRTRRPFRGGLVLLDSDEFDKYNDYILSATYFDFKKVKYNIGLFYYVLWKNCEKKQWMDSNVVKQFKKYMLRRVSGTKCNIGLSSLPLDPQVKTSLPTALWYCVEMSSHIFKDDPYRFAHERLRMYYGIAHAMIEILNNFNYDLDEEFINKRRDLIRHVMILKKIPTQGNKYLFLVENIFKKVNGFLVSEIAHPENVKKLNYLKLNHKEMLRDDVVEEEVNLTNYVHFLYYTDNVPIPICEKTFRPYFIVGENESFYSEYCRVAKKIVVSKLNSDVVLLYEELDELEFNRMFSLCKMYVHCVKDKSKFPTLDEFMEYVMLKKKFVNGLVTIFPVNVCEIIKCVFGNYESVIRGVSVEDFVKVCDITVNRLQRIKIEEKLVFANDVEIMKLISKEEAKVKLKTCDRTVKEEMELCEDV